MRIALDLDGTIDEHAVFFRFLSSALRGAGHRVVILTYRDADKRSRTAGQLAKLGIVYDEIHFAGSLEGKGRLCRKLAIDIFFDDQDECIVPVDERTLVFKIRNGGNFDFDQRQWLSTGRLTRLL